MKIHKEGHQLLILIFLFLAGGNLLITYIFPENIQMQRALIFASIIFFLMVLQFFRNPRVLIESDEKEIKAPADGKVVVIEEIFEEEYFQSKKMQVSIFMSPLNVHINRNPVSGLVKYFKYHAGQYFVAWHPKSSQDNERTTFVVELKSGLEIMVRQIAGVMARRIKWYIEEGDIINQGEEFGFIKFGSRVDIYLPLDAVIKVSVGDKTKAGKTVIAELS